MIFILGTLLVYSVANDSSFDVLVYGSTPSGVMAAVAAARHQAKTALLSQRDHIGGVCSGGLGQSDVGSCATEVIGGLALEFFERNAKSYPTPQPRAPWNLEPHVAKEAFLAMLNESGVTLLPPAQVLSAQKSSLGSLQSIVVQGGRTYNASVFIDASYEGDLMARSGVDYTFGRESRSKYNETGAGSQKGTAQYGIEYINPYNATTGKLLPLLVPQAPLPEGEGDKQIQAYNFRICVTDNPALRVPFRKPDQYDPARYVILWA